MRIKILTILKLAGSTGMPETALRLELELRFRIRLGEMEFTEALQALESGGHIKQETDDITGDRVWWLKGNKK